MYDQQSAGSLGREVDVSRMGAYLAKVFGWMFVGVLVTAATFVFALFSPAIQTFLFAGSGYMILMVVQVVAVLALSFRLQKMSAGAATGLFLLYSALTGLTFSSLAMIFELASLLYVFVVTSLLFGTLAVYGTITKRDLTGIGTLAIFGLMAILLASVVNWFFASTQLDYIITIVGIVIFVVLIAYDTQKIKNFYLFAVEERDADENSDPMRKMAVYAAFTLYLDFINLFLKLLRLMGKRRN